MAILETSPTNPLRIYLDTSVISHLFHDDSPDRMAETRELFDNAINIGVYDTYVSSVVIDELGRTRADHLRAQLLDVLTQYPINLLPDGNQEVARLAGVYTAQGIVPANNPEDALHLAYATVFELDVLVTWNYRHLARARTASLVRSINLAQGYPKLLLLLTPLEVLQP
jgi:predicted nucleic acid-binding protein